MTDDSPDSGSPPASIGPYEVVAILHRGALATIYAARGSDADSEVAIKVLSDAPRESAGDRLPESTHAARRLVHRHIVRVLDAGEDDGLSYVVMERLRGRRLRELKADPSFDADAAARIDLVAQLCTGLHYAHEHGVVHGNISPDNVFITDDFVVKILNFGIVSSGESTVLSDTALSGFEYMSPEQLMGREAIDGRSDLFSAAVILYELLSGGRPFQGSSPTVTLARIVREDPAPLEGMKQLDRIIRRALEKDPAKRFDTAQEFAYALWTHLTASSTADESEEPRSETVYGERSSGGDGADVEAPPDLSEGAQLSQQTIVYAGIAAAAIVVTIGVLLYSC